MYYSVLLEGLCYGDWLEETSFLCGTVIISRTTRPRRFFLAEGQQTKPASRRKGPFGWGGKEKGSRRDDRLPRLSGSDRKPSVAATHGMGAREALKAAGEQLAESRDRS
jgi:hypothetical protein